MRGKSGLFSGRTMPRTLHFYGPGDTLWETLANWWEDSAFTVPASSLPSAADDVVMHDWMTTSEAGTKTLRSLTVLAGGVTYITISVSDGAVFGSGSYLWDGGTIVGNAVFNGNSASYGSVNGNATFNNTSSNYGTVTGTKTCNTSGAC